MNNETFSQLLISGQADKPAPKKQVKPKDPFARLLAEGVELTAEQKALLSLEGRAVALLHRLDGMSHREQLQLVEAARKGKRRAGRRAGRLSETDRACTALERLIQKAFERDKREQERRFGGTVSESRQPRRRRRTTEALQTGRRPGRSKVRLSDLDKRGVSLCEAVEHNPAAASPVDLVGENARQRTALARGGEAGLQRYLAQRKKLCGF